GAAAVPVHHPDLPSQILPPPLPLARRLLPSLRPAVIAGPGHVQRVAQRRQRVVLPLPLDPPEPHGLWLAKKAVAFFKISFSISSRFTCRSSSLTRARSRAGSSEGGVTPSSGSSGPSAGRCQPAFLSHMFRVVTGTPRSRAARATSWPLTRTRSIASRLNCPL